MRALRVRGRVQEWLTGALVPAISDAGERLVAVTRLDVAPDLVVAHPFDRDGARLGVHAELAERRRHQLEEPVLDQARGALAGFEELDGVVCDHGDGSGPVTEWDVQPQVDARRARHGYLISSI